MKGYEWNDSHITLFSVMSVLLMRMSRRPAIFSHVLHVIAGDMSLRRFATCLFRLWFRRESIFPSRLLQWSQNLHSFSFLHRLWQILFRPLTMFTKYSVISEIGAPWKWCDSPCWGLSRDQWPMQCNNLTLLFCGSPLFQFISVPVDTAKI